MVKTSVRPSHQSSEEDQEEGAVNSAVTPMLGSIGAVAQRGATTEEDSDAGKSPLVMFDVTIVNRDALE